MICSKPTYLCDIDAWRQPLAGAIFLGIGRGGGKVRLARYLILTILTGLKRYMLVVEGNPSFVYLLEKGLRMDD